MVSVEVAGLAPGVTEGGARPQDGTGDGPVTEQVRAMLLEKPLGAVKVRMSVAWAPRCIVNAAVAGLTEKSSATPRTKFAVTDLSASIVTEQGVLVSEHAPLQFFNTELASGLAPTVTRVPLRYFAEQVLPQLMVTSIPGGCASTTPEPLPVFATVSV